MRIAKVDIAFNDTDDISINVWLPGCRLNCDECFTPELKNFNAGFEVPIEDVIGMIEERLEMTKTVCFLGGNPPDHKDIEELTRKVKELGTTVWVYSGYDFERIQGERWIDNCDYIKAGPYKKELASIEYSYASTNQKLYKRESDKWIMEECNASIS